MSLCADILCKVHFILPRLLLLHTNQALCYNVHLAGASENFVSIPNYFVLSISVLDTFLLTLECAHLQFQMDRKFGPMSSFRGPNFILEVTDVAGSQIWRAGVVGSKDCVVTGQTSDALECHSSTSTRTSTSSPNNLMNFMMDILRKSTGEINDINDGCFSSGELVPELWYCACSLIDLASWNGTKPSLATPVSVLKMSAVKLINSSEHLNILFLTIKDHLVYMPLNVHIHLCHCVSSVIGKSR